MKRLVAPDLSKMPVDLSESDNPAYWLRDLSDDAHRGVPLADFECPHGHLPHDRTIECSCYTHDAEHAEQQDAAWRDRYDFTENLT